MAEELKVLSPEVIEDTPFPVQDETATSQASQSTSADSVSPSTTKKEAMPTRRVAYEVIGTALNTKSRKILGEFELTDSGGLRVGRYEHGVSGDLRITPSGMTARDKAGFITFAIDGDGNAIFKGMIQSESLITGLLAVGDNNVILDGEAQRIVINDGTNDRILIGRQDGGF